MINLDHNATTPLHPQVRAAMVDVLGRGGLGNPSSTHALGRATRDVVEAARRDVAAAVGAKALGITFTSGGTEADNLAVMGSARALQKAGKPCGVLTSRIEHPAIVGAAEALGAAGIPVAWVEAHPDGRVPADRVAAAVAEHPEVGVVSIAAANHELGNVTPMAELTAAVRSVRSGIVIHCDAVQAFGKIPVDFAAWGVDLMSISSHKVYGPTGVGALVHHTHGKLAARSFGGAQERGRRVGTENWMAVHGFGAAARLAASEGVERCAALAPLRDELRAAVESAGGRIHGCPDLANTLNFGFEGASGELMCMNLDLEGVAVSTGAACSAGSLEPSKVLLALGLSPLRAAEAVRVSMGRETSADDVQRLTGMLPGIVERVRAAGLRAS